MWQKGKFISIRNATAFLEFPSLGHHENKFSHGLAKKYKKYYGKNIYNQNSS